MPLVLRPQRGEVPETPNASGVLRIEGERPWAVCGPSAEIELASEDLGDVAERVHAEVLHLDFGNSVGVFRVRGLGTLEVVSGKWDECHFDTMLADVARVASALPFAAGTAGPLPYDRSLAARDDLLYHAYVYIRHILSDSSPRHVRLLPALRAILADPHRRAETEAVLVPVECLARMDHETILAIASPRGALVPARSARVPAVLQGHLPRLLPERQYRTTSDTPENRFVKAFLELTCAVLARMKEAFAKDTRFSRRVRAECYDLEALIAPFHRHPLWRAVGPMTQLPANSTVLQRRRGYRDVFRHFALLRLATRHLPLSAAEARDLLEGKDIASLYEMWCFFQVVDVLSNLLGPPAKCDAPARDDLQARIAHEFEVRWSCGIRALYNATFSPRRPADRKTYSVPLRPDVVLVLGDGAVHVLDAKFKLQWLDDTEDELDRATVKANDVYKMHAYRDAIDAARSAWILYPGTELREFFTGDGLVDGVGAVPLRPEPGGAEALEALLRRIVGRPSATLGGVSESFGVRSAARASVIFGGPTRQVAGRKGMSWEEEDWVDAEAVAHRAPDE